MKYCIRCHTRPLQVALATMVLLVTWTVSASAEVLERVVAIGASATHGFGATLSVGSEAEPPRLKVNFADALRACLGEQSGDVTSLGDLFFFTDPMSVGPELVDQALAKQPTLVIAIDFLFWFSYGENSASRTPIRDESERLALLEEGLKLLERFDCPVVVGDIPDMSAAVGRMLTPAQQPATNTLEKINQRIREWAAVRQHIRVAPMAELIATMNRGEAISLGSCAWPEGCRDELLQRDRLHPTGEGLACLGVLTLMQLRTDPALIDTPAPDRTTVVQRMASLARDRLRPRGTAATQPEAAAIQPAVN